MKKHRPAEAESSLKERFFDKQAVLVYCKRHTQQGSLERAMSVYSEFLRQWRQRPARTTRGAELFKASQRTLAEDLNSQNLCPWPVLI